MDKPELLQIIHKQYLHIEKLKGELKTLKLKHGERLFE